MSPQLCAIEMGAKCIIVCDGAPVSFTITKLAQDKGCFIIKLHMIHLLLHVSSIRVFQLDFS